MQERIRVICDHCKTKFFFLADKNNPCPHCHKEYKQKEIKKLSIDNVVFPDVPEITESSEEE